MPATLRESAPFLVELLEAELDGFAEAVEETKVVGAGADSSAV